MACYCEKAKSSSTLHCTTVHACNERKSMNCKLCRICAEKPGADIKGNVPFGTRLEGSLIQVSLLHKILLCCRDRE